MADAPPTSRPHLDVVGTVLSAVGLGLFVFGVLRSSAWGWVVAKPGAPSLFGVSATVWLVLAGGVVVFGFLAWERRQVARDAEPLVDPAMLDNRQLRGGLTIFFFQYLLQSGLFFVVPLFLSVALGLSALQTGVRLLPLSVTLLLAAAGIPRLWPQASPRRVVRRSASWPFSAASCRCWPPSTREQERRSPPGPCSWPASASARSPPSWAPSPCRRSPTSRAARWAGSRTPSPTSAPRSGRPWQGRSSSPASRRRSSAASRRTRPCRRRSRREATTKLAAGAPFVSDAQLQARPGQGRRAAQDVGRHRRRERQGTDQGAAHSLAVLAFLAVLSLFFTRRIPTEQPSDIPTTASAGAARKTVEIIEDWPVERHSDESDSRLGRRGGRLERTVLEAMNVIIPVVLPPPCGSRRSGHCRRQPPEEFANDWDAFSGRNTNEHCTGSRTKALQSPTR